MSSFSYIATRDDASILNGDKGWKGVDMLTHPALVQPSLASEAKNLRFRYGLAETRAGYTIPAWTGAALATPLATGVFRDPVTHLDWGLIAGSAGVYAVRPGTARQAIALPAGVTTLAAPISFVQCFDVVMLFRGESLAPLAMSDVSVGFAAISQTPSGPGTEAIPNAERGLFFGNRLLVPHGDDEVAISDPNDYTRYVPVYSEAYINAGSSDRLLALAGYNESTFIAFKEHSVHAILNCYGSDWGSVMQRTELTSEYGLAAPRAFAQCGKDIWFLSEFGVMSLTSTEQGKLQAAILPESTAIQPLIDRINWASVSGAVAAYCNSRFYLAVPLDNATVNSTVLVYDFIAKAWSGYDDLTGIAGVKDFFRLNINGRNSLLALMSDGYVRQVEFGPKDETVPGTRIDIPTTLKTRAYTNLDGEWHSQDILRWAMQYADPTYTVTLTPEGVNEDAALVSAATVDRTKYFNVGMAAFTLTNANNDFLVKRRQDYTLYAGDNAVIGTGTGELRPDVFQEISRAVTVGKECRCPQVKLTTTTGRVRWLQCAIEGRNQTTRQGVLT